MPQNQLLCPDGLFEFKRQEIETGLLYVSFLLADLRCMSAPKTKFDPNQPRDDHGRWTNTGGGEADTIFSPDKPGWHDYTSGPNLVCSAEQACSREEISDQLLRFAVPGQDPSKPVVHDETYPVYIPDTGVVAGNVRTTIGPDGLSITNRTEVGHIFYDGQVTRFASQNGDGSWSVTTRGTGNNQIYGMSVVNQYAGPHVFDMLDQQFRENIRLHHGSRKSVADKRFLAVHVSDSGRFAVASANGGTHAF
jgi:hypothetical protein